jgi:hypothetical protein
MAQDPGAIRHEVEEARASLGETIEALAYKANAPRRMKDRAAKPVRGVLRSMGRHRAVVAAAAVGIAAIAAARRVRSI